MLSADLHRLLNEKLEVVLSQWPAAPTTRGSRFSLASPHFGGMEQGTSPGLSGGVAASAAFDSSVVSSLESEWSVPRLVKEEGSLRKRSRQ
jgi:hypothetical protein